MFKMIKGHMETIDNVAIYPMISLLIFFLFFVGLFWWVYTYKKEQINAFKNIPLEDEDHAMSNQNQPSQNNHYEKL
ncbi:MAG: cbb3-type cytochrome c oxidase subunit 3 [Flavobacteriaceae bacterium]|nr:cbb3-type cytochrome c oxidase subunit 3 [Flavobacteriaceae bacterium]